MKIFNKASKWFTSLTNVKKSRTNKNSSEEPKPEQLIQREQMPGSPFWYIGTEKGWMISMKNYALTKYHPTKEEALKEFNDNHWNITASVCVILHESIANEAAALMLNEATLKKAHEIKENFEKSAENQTNWDMTINGRPTE